jgi:hypothetical protein
MRVEPNHPGGAPTVVPHPLGTHSSPHQPETHVVRRLFFNTQDVQLPLSGPVHVRGPPKSCWNLGSSLRTSVLQLQGRRFGTGFTSHFHFTGNQIGYHMVTSRVYKVSILI